MSAARTWSVQGSAAKPYTITRAENDRMSCTCPRWMYPRSGANRLCKHIAKIAQDERLTLTVRDLEVFVEPNSGVPFDATMLRPDELRQREATAANADAILARNGFAVQQPEPVSTSRSEKQTTKPEPSDRDAFISPQLATKMPAGWDADRYDPALFVMEEKFDGHRLIVRKNSRVRAWSRLGNIRTLPKHIADAAWLLPSGVVVDGELIIPGGHSYAVTAGQNAGTEVLVLFDILEAEGQSTMKYTQDERTVMLAVATSAAIEWRDEQGRQAIRLTVPQPPSMDAVRAIWARGGEGGIIKRRAASYRAGVRSLDWVKVKALGHTVITVTGFDGGKSGPYSTTVGVEANGNVVRVKTLDNATLRAIDAAPTSFIGRRLVVEFQERTPDGSVRHGMWDHLAAEGEV